MCQTGFDRRFVNEQFVLALHGSQEHDGRNQSRGRASSCPLTLIRNEALFVDVQPLEGLIDPEQTEACRPVNAPNAPEFPRVMSWSWSGSCDFDHKAPGGPAAHAAYFAGLSRQRRSPPQR